MPFKRWLLTGFLVVLTASFAASTVVMVVLREREVERRVLAEEALLREQETAQSLMEQLRSHKAKTARLEIEFLALERANRFALVRLRGLEKKFTHLQKEFAKERAEKQTLLKERNVINNQFFLTSSENKSLRTRMNKMLVHAAEEVDLGQIVVNATPSLEGKVILVNDQFQFVVIDLGSEKELSVGTLLNVYRKDQLVGRIQVEQIREKAAACRILPEWSAQTIQENDQVKEL